MRKPGFETSCALLGGVAKYLGRHFDADAVPPARVRMREEILDKGIGNSPLHVNKAHEDLVKEFLKHCNLPRSESNIEVVIDLSHRKEDEMVISLHSPLRIAPRRDQRQDLTAQHKLNATLRIGTPAALDLGLPMKGKMWVDVVIDFWLELRMRELVHSHAENDQARRHENLVK